MDYSNRIIKSQGFFFEDYSPTSEFFFNSEYTHALKIIFISLKEKNSGISASLFHQAAKTAIKGAIFLSESASTSIEELKKELLSSYKLFSKKQPEYWDYLRLFGCYLKPEIESSLFLIESNLTNSKQINSNDEIELAFKICRIALQCEFLPSNSEEESLLTLNSQIRIKNIRKFLDLENDRTQKKIFQISLKIFKPKNPCSVLSEIPKIKLIQMDEDKSLQLYKLKQIKLFGESFIFDYGPHLVSSTSQALKEGFAISGMKEKIVDLLFKIMGIGCELEKENCKDSATIFKQKLLALAKETCKENLVNLLDEVSGAVSSLLEKSDLKKEFIRCFLDVAAPMCFVESSGKNEKYKEMVVNILEGLKEFMGDLNICLGKLSDEELSIESEQNILIEHFRARMEERKLFCIIPSSKDPQIIQENMRKEIVDVVSSIMGLGDKESASEKQLLHLILSAYFSSMVKRLLSPETVMLIIHQLLKKPLDLSKTNLESKSEGLKIKLDPLYTEALSSQFQGLFQEVLNLSGTSETIKSIINLLYPKILPVINQGVLAFQEKLEEKSKMGHLNDSILSLLVVADQLFQDEKNENQFSLQKYFSMETNEIQMIREDMDKQIKSRPAEFIKETLEKNFYSVVCYALQTLQPETYFQNLINRLYRLSQQEMLLMIAFSYIKHSVFNFKIVNLNDKQDGEPDEWLVTNLKSNPVEIKSNEIIIPKSQPSTKSHEGSSEYEILQKTAVFNNLSLEVQKKIRKNEIRIVEQYNLIDSFTRAFFVNYGPYIFSSATKAISETVQNPKKAEKLTELIFKAALPIQTQSTEGLFNFTMVSICQQIFQEAMPNLVNFASKLATPIVEDQLTGPDFIHAALDYFTPMLFIKCSKHSDLQKKVILNLFDGVRDFLTDLNLCNQKAASQKSKSNDFGENIVLLMKEKMGAKKIPISKDEGAKEVIFLQLEDALKVMVGDKVSANESLVSFLLSTYLSCTLDRLFSSDTLCILLERLFLKPLDFSCKSLQAMQLEKKPLNESYTKNLSEVFQSLCIEILKLAGTSNELLKIVELITPLLKGKISEYALEVHKVLDDMANTESINDALVTPIFFIDQILYDKSKNVVQDSIIERRPAFLKFMNLSEKELSQIKERLDHQIKNESKEKIRNLINDNLSLPLRITLNLLPTEEFCQTLTERLYLLSQNEVLLKMLLGYLIRSVKLSFL